MGLIRKAEFSSGGVVLDLGDLLAQGEALKRAAGDQAEAILADARAERERLLAGAAEQGRAEGLAAGLAQGKAEGLEAGRAQAHAEHAAALAAVEKAWTDALEAFEAARDRMLQDARRDVLRLALAIAGRIIHRAVRTDPGVVADQMEAVLALVSRPTRLVLAVHPSDMDRAAGALPALAQRFRNAAHAELVADASLAPGSCIARAEGGGEIDASIDTQLDRIAEALVPGQARPRLSLASEEPGARGEAA